VVCPVFQSTGRESASPRGKIHLLGKLPATKASAALMDIVSQCLLCNACRATCPKGINIPALIRRARQDLPSPGGEHTFLRLLARKIAASPSLLAGTACLLSSMENGLLTRLPPTSGLRLRLGLLAPDRPTPHGAPEPALASLAAPTDLDLNYFAGCYACHLAPDIPRAVNQLSLAKGHRPTTTAGQTCCGLATLAAGRPAEARALARRNINAFAANRAPILTSCGSCHAQLSSYPELLAEDATWRQRAQEFSNRLLQPGAWPEDIQPASNRTPKHDRPSTTRVFYHTPCHLRFGAADASLPPRLIRAAPNTTLVELPNGPQCCGHGGLFNLAHPRLSEKIGRRLADAVAPLQVDLIVTSCTGCLLQWRQLVQLTGMTCEVKHLAVFLRDRLP